MVEGAVPTAAKLEVLPATKEAFPLVEKTIPEVRQAYLGATDFISGKFKDKFLLVEEADDSLKPSIIRQRDALVAKYQQENDELKAKGVYYDGKTGDYAYWDEKKNKLVKSEEPVTVTDAFASLQAVANKTETERNTALKTTAETHLQTLKNHCKAIIIQNDGTTQEISYADYETRKAAGEFAENTQISFRLVGLEETPPTEEPQIESASPANKVENLSPQEKLALFRQLAIKGFSIKDEHSEEFLEFVKQQVDENKTRDQFLAELKAKDWQETGWEEKLTNLETAKDIYTQVTGQELPPNITQEQLQEYFLTYIAGITGNKETSDEKSVLKKIQEATGENSSIIFFLIYVLFTGFSAAAQTAAGQAGEGRS